MNLKKLARFLCGELPNSNAINIADFVNVLENNLDLEEEGLNNWKYKSWAFVFDYIQLLTYVLDSNEWKWKICKILQYLILPDDFIVSQDFSKYKCVNSWEITWNLIELRSEKVVLLEQFSSVLSELEASNNNKLNWNKFEELCEQFLLKSSFFEPWHKEFEFEDGTAKIDRIMKLKKHIIPHIEDTNYWYIVLESKYKTTAEVSAWDTWQLKEYIDRLNDYGLCNYGISITTNWFKETYKTKIWDRIKKIARDWKCFVSLIDMKEVTAFLTNEWEYEDMNFDEFIERSFIKRLY